MEPEIAVKQSYTAYNHYDTMTVGYEQMHEMSVNYGYGAGKVGSGRPIAVVDENLKPAKKAKTAASGGILARFLNATTGNAGERRVRAY